MDKAYRELIYLAAYYRWSVTHGAHIGRRSPIHGRPYSQVFKVHERPWQQACMALAKAYLQQARAIRLREPGIHSVPII